jgi:ArsR family transcriptional regulator
MASRNELAAFFKALADPTRLRILTLLAGGEICVCHVHDALRLPQPTVSRHLAYLRRTGVVARRRDGLWVHYRIAERLNPHHRAVLDAAIHASGHVAATRTDERRLRKHVQRPSAKRSPVVPCCATISDASFVPISAVKR